jgi:nitroreductase
MTATEAIGARRAIRRYQERDVPDEILGRVLDAARHAPSSMDGQPWCFIVIRDPATNRRLAGLKNAHCPPEKRAFPADFLADAPVVLVICSDRFRSYGREIENGVLAAAAAMFAAAADGLGSVFLTAYQPGDPGLSAGIADLLGLPEQIQPVALLPLGFPDETPKPKRLRPLAEMVHQERFGSRGSLPRGTE